MTQQAPQTSVARSPASTRASQALGLVVAAIGTAALSGWLLRSPGLARLLPFWLPMKPNAAACFILAGLSLYGHRSGAPARLLGWLSAAIGLATLVEYVTGVDFHIDRLFLIEPPGVPMPDAGGRMAFSACLLVLTSGVSLGVLGLPRGDPRLGQASAIAAASIVILSLAGYLLGQPDVVALNTETRIAQGALFASAVLAAGLFTARPERGVANLLFRRSQGGAAFRRLLPAVIILPLSLDVIQQMGEKAGVLSESADVTIGALILILLLCAMAYWHCENHDREESAKRAAEYYNRSLIEASPDPLVTIGADGKIMDVNAATETAAGLPRERLIGTDFCDYFTDPAKARAGYQRIFREGSVRDYPLDLRSMDGRVTPVLYNAAVYRDVEGRVAGVFAVARDISERQKAEQALSRSSRALRAMFRCNEALLRADTEEGLLKSVCRVIEKDGEYPFAWVGFKMNDERKSISLEAESGKAGEGYVRAAGITWADEPKGHGPTGTAVRTATTQICRDMLTEASAAPWRELARKRGFRSSISLPLVAEGKVMGALTLYANTADAFKEEEVQLLTAFADDLSFGLMALRARAARDLAAGQLRKLNAELEIHVSQRTSQLAAANKELEAFAYSVSHDLRAPLRHIDGFVDLLCKRDTSRLDEDGRRYLAVIREAAGRMGQLIDDLLKFSRLGRAELSKTSFPLGPLVEEVKAELSSDAAVRAVEWRVGELPAVSADRGLLRVVLENLIGNALKFSRKRPTSVIEIGSREEAAETVLYVKDNGVGFDMSYAEKLFGVFQRLHSEDEFEGTGIGLANVRRVIARHGGRTWAEGRVDGGATFYFSLPKERTVGGADEQHQAHLVGGG